jgi:predicted dehydrogenase
MTRMLGVGVLGLHEGRTMLVALNHSRPTRMTHGRYLPLAATEPTRAAHVRAVAGCEFANYAEQFALAILENRPCSPDLSEGLETLAIMQAARRSLDTGQAVAPSQLLAEYGLDN